ncbi:MAG: prepilin-type N-terminal cleavage/methylation domain-containing protein [Nitrospinales bacterium]
MLVSIRFPGKTRPAAWFDLRKPRRSNQGGFTLLEVLVSVVILSVGFLGTGALVAGVVQKNQEAKRITAGTTLIQDKIESFKNSSFSSINSGSETNIDAEGNAGGAFSRSWTVTTSGNVKTITVTVGWSSKGQTINKSMTTAISQ